MIARGDRITDTLAAAGTTYASDDDPQSIEAALPFSLKLMETRRAGDGRRAHHRIAADEPVAAALVRWRRSLARPVRLAKGRKLVARRRGCGTDEHVQAAGFGAREPPRRGRRQRRVVDKAVVGDGDQEAR
jgi:hypothetical protein